jgi:hypothetical protein
VAGVPPLLRAREPFAAGHGISLRQGCSGSALSLRASGTSEASKAGRRLNELTSLAGAPCCWLLASLEGCTPNPRTRCMPSRRTIRKPTLWTPKEWRRIEDAAQLRRVPPLRHVREAALAAQLPPAADRRGAHALMRQSRASRGLSVLGHFSRLQPEKPLSAASITHRL